MSNRMIANALLGFFLLASAGCGGQLYKVAPLPSGAPPELSSANAGGFNIGAAVLDGEASLERFEANLPLAGVIAVDVRLVNDASGTIGPNSIRFELRDAAGAKLKQIAPKKALKRVMNYYGNSFYTKAAYSRTLGDYDSVALKINNAIAPREERRGFVFFETKQETASVDGLILSVAGPFQPLSLQLQTPRD